VLEDEQQLFGILGIEENILSAGAWPAFYGATKAYEPQPQLRNFPAGIRSGAAVLHSLEQQMAEYQKTQETTLRELRLHFVMPADVSVDLFLASHRSLPHLLNHAVLHLKRCFGDDVVVKLEVSDEDAGPKMLYAVAIWRGSAQSAEAALERFDEAWWLDNSRKNDLTFTYELE